MDQLWGPGTSAQPEEPQWGAAAEPDENQWLQGFSGSESAAQWDTGASGASWGAGTAADDEPQWDR